MCQRSVSASKILSLEKRFLLLLIKMRPWSMELPLLTLCFPPFSVSATSIWQISTIIPSKVQWGASPTDPDDDTELLVFSQGNTILSTKVLSFYHKESFNIEVVYAQPDLLPGAINPWIGKLTAKEVPVLPSGDTTCQTEDETSKRREIRAQ